MKSVFTLFFIALVSLLSSPLSAQNWEIVAYNVLPADVKVQALSVVSEQVVWVLAGLSFDEDLTEDQLPIVMRTIDGGQTWDYRVVNEAMGRRAMDIVGLDANTAIISTRSIDTERAVFKTTDGGLNWQKIIPPTLSGGLALHFFDGQNGVAVNRYYIATTADAGNTWTEVPAANIPQIADDEYNLFFNVGNFTAQVGDRVWIGTSKGRVMRTIDRGQHWDIFQAADTSENILSLAFSDSLHGVAVVPGTADFFYTTARLFSTADGGETWTEMPAAPTGQVTNAVGVPGAPNHYFMGNRIYMGDFSAFTVDLNTNGLDSSAWITQIDSFPLNAGQFISPTVGYLAGFSFRSADTLTINGSLEYTNVIYKWNGNLTHTVEKPKLPVLRMSLAPNPTSNWMQIDLDGISSAQGVALEVSNAKGQVVLSKMVFDQRLDVQTLPPGAYVLTVRAEGRVAAGVFIKR